MEFNVGRGAVRIFHVDPDGELIAAAHHQQSEEILQVAPVMQRR